ncbi:MAG: hypothetical protein WDN69_06205 [Aliidongia sp.]
MGLAFQAPDTLYTDDFDTGSLFSVSVPPPSAPPVSLAAAVLPDSRSVQVGAPATIFASMINTGTAELGGCGVSLRTGAPAALSMSFQATNPTTNQPIGARNQTVDDCAECDAELRSQFPIDGRVVAARLRAGLRLHQQPAGAGDQRRGHGRSQLLDRSGR